MKKLILFCFFSSAVLISVAQNFNENQFQNLKVLESELEKAKSDEEKTNALISLYLYHTHHNDSLNIETAKKYQQQLEIFTHQTNNPELIARALYWLSFGFRGEELEKRLNYLKDFANLHSLNFYKARVRLRISNSYAIYNPDRNKAADLVHEALNLSRDLNDSLKIIIFLHSAARYNDIGNQVEALRLAFTSYEMASKMRSRNLMLLSNYVFEDIYGKLKNYNKAIQHSLKSLELLKSFGKPHLMAIRHANVAALYFNLNQSTLGNYHTNEAYRLADSIKGSKRLYNQINGQTITALANSDNKQVLSNYLKQYRQHFFIQPSSQFLDNVTLAAAYLKVGNLDSARTLINKAGIYLAPTYNATIRERYYRTLSFIASHDKDWRAATENYKQCLSLALAQNDLTDGIQYSDSLKKTLIRQNLLPQALYYDNLKDSLQHESLTQLDKEELTRQEVAALEKEKEIQAIEKEKEKRQRHNVQYLGITFGVVALFVILLLLGFLKVSPSVIKILSFFSFLLFFEFIFLIFKKQVYVFTHGEPWKDLAFMVLLAAIMVPLHHWSEHKVVEYLRNSKIAFPKTKFTFRKTAPKKEILVDE